MSADAVGRRVAQRCGQRGVDLADDVFHSPRPVENRLQDLLLALLPVREVLVDERRRIVDDRSMTWKQAARIEIAHEPERGEVARRSPPFRAGMTIVPPFRARSPQ